MTTQTTAIAATSAHLSSLPQNEALSNLLDTGAYAPDINRLSLLRVPIGTFGLQEAEDLVATWAHWKTQTRLVTFTNVHMLTESRHNARFYRQLCEMDMNCADGMPLVWLARLTGKRIARVCGPEFFEEFFANTQGENLRHFFYGGKEGVAERVSLEFRRRYPDLQVAGCISPPFRVLTQEEDEALIAQINASDADIVWVSLGCPKQEAWMAEHRDRLKPCVVLSVGMAFDIIIGEKKRAPSFLRKSGLEWLFRLLKEPRRLGGRYLKSNLTFLLMLLMDATRPPVSDQARQFSK